MNSLRSFMITFLIALLIFGLCAFFITGFVTDSINSLLSGDLVPDQTSGADTSDSDILHGIVEPDDDIKGESFNVLLIGTDYRPSILNNYHPDIETQYPYFEDSAKLIGYNGSLPMFLAAFLQKEKLTREEAEELKKLIDSYVDDRQ